MREYFSRSRKYIDIIDGLLYETDSHRNPARVREEMVTGEVTRDEINSDIYMLYLNAIEPDMVCASDYPEKDEILRQYRNARSSLKLFIKSDRDNVLVNSLAASLVYESGKDLGVLWKTNLMDTDESVKNPEIRIIDLDDHDSRENYIQEDPSSSSIIDFLKIEDLSNDIDIANDILNTDSLILQLIDVPLVKIGVLGDRGRKLISDALGKELANHFVGTDEYLIDSRVYSTIVSLDSAMKIVNQIARERIIRGITRKLMRRGIIPTPWRYCPTHMLIHGFLQPISDATELNALDKGHYSVGHNECPSVNSSDGDIKSIKYLTNWDGIRVEFRDGNKKVFDSSTDLLDYMRSLYGKTESDFGDFLLRLAI